jgi:serine protease Do
VGRVVGVNSSIFSMSGGSIGIGFAIPIERAVRVADELRRHGAVRRAWAGLEVAGADDLREWKRAGGLKVTAVSPGGPAARAGMTDGDVMIEAAGRRIRTFLDWEGVLLDTGPGSTLIVTFRRGSTAPRIARIAMSDLPTSVAEKVAVLDGLKVITLTPAVRQERGVQSQRGALVFEVAPDVQRVTALRPGDVVFQADREPIAGAEDLERAITAAARRGAVTLWFERRGTTWRSTFPLR